MIETVLKMAGIGTLVAGATFAGYQYKEVHLPDFEDLKVKVEYQDCIQRCMDTCKANGIPIDKCKCDHCNVYKVK